MQKIDDDNFNKLLQSQYLHTLFKNDLISFENLEILKDKNISIYTGKGPSNELHLGHLFLLKITQEVKRILNAKLYYMISDDQKYLNNTLSTKAITNITNHIESQFKDVGILQNTKNIDILYTFALPFVKFFKIGRIKSLLGLKNSDNIGKIFFIPIQCSVINYLHSLNQAVIIITGRDQEPYFKEMNRYLKSENRQVASY